MPTLFYNAKIFTGRKFLAASDAVYVENDKIKFVGTEKEIRPKIGSDIKEINLKQKILLPGFIDTHTHFVQYALSKSEIDLSEANNLSEVKQILLENTKKNSKWISAKELNFNQIEDINQLDRKFLDRIFPNKPISISSKDLHSFICNSKALEKMNLNESVLPEGSTVGRYPDGSPNGILEERSWLLIEKVKPKLSNLLKEQLVDETMQCAHKFGLTGIHIMEEKSSFELLKNMQKKGKFKLRVCWHFPLDILDEIIEIGVKSYSGDKWMKIGGVKIFMDGSLGSETAYMFQPYKTDRNNYGYLARSFAEYYQLILKAAGKGISPTTHSIGDRCNQIVVDAIIKLMQVKAIQTENIFPRIEHFQIARPEEQNKVAKHKIYCAVQPAHISLDAKATEKKVGKYGRNSYPFRSLLNKGAILGFGSDVPVETINPLTGIYSAVNRKYQNNPQNKSWIPREKISIIEALKAYTLDAALGSQEQNIKGSIEVGKLADLIVLQDFTKKKAEFWLEARSLLTMIDGKIVHNIL